MLGFYVWLYKHGITGAITRDVIKKYKNAELQIDDEQQRIDLVIEQWLALNGPPIMLERDGLDTKIRLEIKLEKWNNEPPKTLYHLFRDILYIETEITVEEPSVYNICGIVFVEEALKSGLDFKKDYLSEARLLVRLGKVREKNIRYSI